MKSFMRALAFAIGVISMGSAFADPIPVTLKEVTDKVTKENYAVLQNAQRTYQAKEAVQLARRNLLPRLNLWRIIEVPTNPLSLLGLVEDIAPFLVPSNWIRVKEQKIFAKAADYAYRSLWANEVMTARGLFFQSNLEDHLYEALRANRDDLELVYQITKARESMGAVPAGSAAQIEIQRYALGEELRIVETVLHENRTQLAYLLGMPGNEEAKSAGIIYLDPATTAPLRYNDHIATVLGSSYELKQFEQLVIAADYVEDERYFSFLGTSSMSRGLFGGIFDSLPYQDGLGFGLGPSVRIVEGEQNVLKIQKESVAETLRRNLKVLVESFNLDLGFRQNALQRLQIAEKYWASLLDRMKLGEVVDSLYLVEASRARAEAASAYHAIETRLLLGQDRLRRLTYQDDYQNAHGKLR